LITGEERIEPPGARWYLCTAESMPLNKDFAFVALDEAQLGADPERGHIFTDRLLHARGREETMILGSEALRPMIKALLPEAEIISRPRFSTLSYAGPKKLSRLPSRSAIVAFSVEQVYAVAELLRRLRGGAAVVMGALSPRTRNAQVEMFQSGEVDYLVATDAIGMGLNLDVQHIAFAGLSKFDGHRTRRLTISEMAQIAGRAGRHQRDGTFGTIAGEAGELTADEVLAIEGHVFPALDWMYWREAEPRTANLATLIADLESKPDGPPLRAAPEAVDLEVLKRLADMPQVTARVVGPTGVARLWEAASLPDFRQTGAEHHSRFVAGLWQHLASGEPLPHSYVAGEIARLDNIQGDVDTLSGRIAAARTWSYIAHRSDWVEDPPAMAARTRELEERLSDALHNALRQRFVDRRTTMLLRRGGFDAAAVPVDVDDQGQVHVDGEHIGHLDGFSFRPDKSAKVGEHKLLLAAAERHLAGYLDKKARALAMADNDEFNLAADAEGRPAITWQGNAIGHLVKGRTLMQPQFKPVRAVAGLEGDALRAVTERAEAWIAAQLEKHMGGLVALSALAQDAGVDGQVRALAAQLADAGGIAGRHYLGDTLAALPKESRGAARKAGIVFGALDVYHHAVLKPAAVRWRSALFAAQFEKPMPQLPPDSAVHLKEWNFASVADCRNAGYRKVGNEYVRIDLAERVIKKAHEARGQELAFALDMTFATSLGLSEDGLNALMRDAGFRRVEPPVEAIAEPLPQEENASDATASDAGEVSEIEPTENVEAEIQNPAAEDSSPDADLTEPEIVPIAAAQPLNLTHWRWVGIRKPKPRDQHPHRPQSGKPQHKGKGAGRPDRAPQPSTPKATAAPSALALQLAALQEKMGTKG
ncbi:MAG: helicase-related protein, partial [Sphingorhabdus sp.]